MISILSFLVLGPFLNRTLASHSVVPDGIKFACKDEWTMILCQWILIQSQFASYILVALSRRESPLL